MSLILKKGGGGRVEFRFGCGECGLPQIHLHKDALETGKYCLQLRREALAGSPDFTVWQGCPLRYMLGGTSLLRGVLTREKGRGGLSDWSA